MKFIRFTILFFMFFGFNTIESYGDNYSEMLINQDYTSYLKSIDTLQCKRQTILLKAIYYTQYMIDFYTDNYEDSLNVIISEASEINPKSDIDYFIKGGVFLNYAFYLQFRGNMWGALNFGNKGVKLLRKVSVESPYYYDALLGMAIYDYGIGKLFFRRKRIIKGLNELNLVSEKGKILYLIAKNIRIILLYNEKSYDEGLSESVELFKQFPKSRLVLWDVVKGFKYQKQYDSLLKYSNMLICTVKEDSIRNDYNLLTIYNWQINAYIKTENMEKAEQVLQVVRDFNIDDKYIKNIRKLRRDIIKRYKFINTSIGNGYNRRLIYFYSDRLNIFVCNA